MTLNIAWGITGCGDLLEDTVRMMERINGEYDVNIAPYLSRDGLLVIRKYELWDELREHFPLAKVEKGPNTPFVVGDLQLGKFDLLIVCPATGNTVAKIAHGIADTLLSNAVAQAMKTQVPVYIYPADQKPGSITTTLPNGRELTLTMREVDLENTEKLKRTAGLNILESPHEFEEVVKQYLKKHGSPQD